MPADQQRVEDDSESTDSIILEPMNLCDVSRHRNISQESSDGSESPTGLPPANPNLFFSAAMGPKKEKDNAEQRRLKRVRTWRRAIMKARCKGDPWEKFHLDEYPTEKARRYRYNALRKTWVIDDCLVKMELEPFNHGAMRECFRMKKLSNFTQCDDWKKDSNNYVAKRYMDEVERDVYFTDVQLQMDAKLWGEEFNRHNPPKKVDIFQMAILEFPHRQGCPLFHCEHFIEGEYVKYNSNSGYVKEDKDHLRLTPHAFSHFTFERSGHELIIVDIQGVGDLYTDPQIHTASGEEYGEGNLGAKGMALFFHTHVCSRICKSLGLSRFDLAPSEYNDSTMKDLKDSQERCKTMIRGQEEVCVMPSRFDKQRLLMHRLPRTMSEPLARPRTISESSSNLTSLTPPESPTRCISSEDVEEFLHSSHNQVTFTVSCSDSDYDSVSASDTERSLIRNRRRRMESESGSVIDDDEKMDFHLQLARRSKPSCIQPPNPDDLEVSTKDSVLGLVHLELCRYHELCRFTNLNSSSYDQEAALFHLEYAARCGIPEARTAYARILLGLQHDILPDLELEHSVENEDKGFSMLLEAASASDMESMVLVAKAYDTGILLGSRPIDWCQAEYWYERSADEGGSDNDPPYQLSARLAEMLCIGGPGLPKDPSRAGELYTEAADAAMAAMKGRLANKWYQLAEEAWAMCEEE
ncbi:eukaryotic elongation factor 2 kinase-like [Neocloeon triangulifer]|uniref:eukaryotic elongation factor 2 kinase-like n=1 Tax=Neocloeon triangulifer TaxID=2078957 RepID=UPI00286EB8F7|nr:eukaryotic elongation factor 2 kinase-like [Neocloeon triangulifer]XP_059487390.1 eukaryotic elongation factor 2 kinase-like [Neocloeon triangulifer]